MKIAHLVSYSVVYPLKKHNGRYEWVLRLARLQAEAGLQPVIYSNPASHIDIPGVEWRSIDGPRDSLDETNRTLWQRAFADTDIDIFHSHFDSLHYDVAHLSPKPIVFTQHWFPNQKVADAAIRSQSANVFAVPVTNYMAQSDEKLGIPAVAPIYHGIDLELFRLSDKPHSDRLLIAGRIAPHKGVKEAVDIALATGAPLDIIGKINDKDRAYWDSFADKVDGKMVRYHGPKTQPEVAEAMQRARAFLFSGQHIEAFGQTPIEAQACGTPVIAADIGANSELIVQGQTGFLAKTAEEFVTAIGQIDTIDSAACRRQAEKFEVHRMANEYTKLYKKLLANSY